VIRHANSNDGVNAHARTHASHTTSHECPSLHAKQGCLSA